MLVSRRVLTMLSQAALVPQSAEDLAPSQASADLRGLLERLAHPAHLLQGLVHLDALLLQLLTIVNQLFLLRVYPLALAPQRSPELLQGALFVLYLPILFLYLLLYLVNADHLMPQPSVLLHNVLLEAGQLIVLVLQMQKQAGITQTTDKLLLDMLLLILYVPNLRSYRLPILAVDVVIGCLRIPFFRAICIICKVIVIFLINHRVLIFLLHYVIIFVSLAIAVDHVVGIARATLILHLLAVELSEPLLLLFMACEVIAVRCG